MKHFIYSHIHLLIAMQYRMLTFLRSVFLIKSQDLKRQTALRLAQEGGENSDTAVKSEYDPSYQRHHPSQLQGRYNPPSHYPSNSNARPQYNMAPQNANQYSQPQDYAQHHATNYYPQNYSHSQEQYVSRNYTDSQLGLGGRGGGAAVRGGQPPQQYPSVRSPSHQQQHQQHYSTPRVPSHELALKDRGSTENSEVSEGGYIVSKGSSSSTSSHHRHDDRNVKQFKARGMQSSDGRRTPVRDGNVQVRSISFCRAFAMEVTSRIIMFLIF